MKESLLAVRELYKIYKLGKNEVHALDGVSLTVEEGEMLAIVGHSGSGKSTLMNILGCLDTPTFGAYQICGKNVLHMRDEELSAIRNRKIGFIFQSFHLLKNLNALENVELPLLYRGIPKKKRRQMALEAIARVGLSERALHKPLELSGGQQQRIAIARAIAGKPPLILADEPTGNLDSKSTEEIMSILKALNDNGHTLLFITHNDEIASQAQRTIRIMDGKIAQDSKKAMEKHEKRSALFTQAAKEEAI